MVKIELNTPLLNLEGTPLLDEKSQPILIGRVIANILASSPSADNADTVRLYDLATEIFRADSYETTSDSTLEFIEKYIDKAQQVPLIKAQLLKAVKKARLNLAQ